MSESAAFGPITSVDQLCEAVLATLREPPLPASNYPLLAYYLAEKERQAGLDERSLPLPKSWVTDIVNDDDPPEQELPRVVVYSAGLANTPVKRGGGLYEVTFSVGVGVVLRGGKRDETRQRLSAYVAALRTCVLQNGPTGIDAWVEWLDEGYATRDASNRRTLGGGEVSFEMTVEMVSRDRYDLPAFPADPYADPDAPPVVDEADADVQSLDD